MRKIFTVRTLTGSTRPGQVAERNKLKIVPTPILAEECSELVTPTSCPNE
jgi:hypothetical protein